MCAVLSNDAEGHPLTTEALVTLLGSERDLSRARVRRLYNCLLSPAAVAAFYADLGDADKCLVARAVSNYRHLVRQYVRSRGSVLDEQLLRMRDIYVEGIGGLTFDGLLAKYSARKSTALSKGTDDGRSVCERIIDSATRTNEQVNAAYGV
jgi:hypothetical protein